MLRICQESHQTSAFCGLDFPKKSMDSEMIQSTELRLSKFDVLSSTGAQYTEPRSVYYSFCKQFLINIAIFVRNSNDWAKQEKIVNS